MRWLFVGALGVGLSLAGLVACSDGDKPRPGFAVNGTPVVPQPTGNTEAGAEGGRDAGDAGKDAGDGGRCSELALTGMLVDREGVLGDPPVALGGVIGDGVYDLKAYQVYVGAGGVAGPTGVTARATIQIAAGKIDQVFETSGSGAPVTVVSRSAYSAVGATFATTELCPNVGGGAQRQFTAADPQLVLTDLVTKEALTFVKR